MTNPKISVILSAYNEEKFIRKAIESVVNQTLKDIEIIIINDGSTDNTLEIFASVKFRISDFGDAFWDDDTSEIFASVKCILSDKLKVIR